MFKIFENKTWRYSEADGTEPSHYSVQALFFIGTVIGPAQLDGPCVKPELLDAHGRPTGTLGLWAMAKKPLQL